MKKNNNRLNTKTKKLGIALIAGLVGLKKLISAKLTQAQITNPALKEDSVINKYESAESGEAFFDYFAMLWRSALSMGILVVLVFFLWGAFEWMTAGGDSAKVQKARDRIINATIGLIIMASIFAIVGFFGELFFGEDFNILEFTFPTPSGT
ncbi:MAG: hypothetical protein PVJ09_02880 [Candidatus Woesebacteria bacterium]|jgi:hypothetical protein